MSPFHPKCLAALNPKPTYSTSIKCQILSSSKTSAGAGPHHLLVADIAALLESEIIASSAETMWSPSDTRFSRRVLASVKVRDAQAEDAFAQGLRRWDHRIIGMRLQPEALGEGIVDAWVCKPCQLCPPQSAAFIWIAGSGVCHHGVLACVARRELAKSAGFGECLARLA